MHGGENDRLLADLDCNGWPQAGRRRALELIRAVRAVHLCGDQHLAVVVKHGIAGFGDGPYGFTSPALVNTIYGRWWHPEGEQPGPNPVPGSPLPWTGDFLDGLGNRITMLAYANPPDIRDERQRGDGHGIARFDKLRRTVTFECWPRFAEVADGDRAQFPGWPVTVQIDDNDGRLPTGWLPELRFGGGVRSVVQVVDEADGEVLYTLRSPAATGRPPVFGDGPFTVRTGADRPDGAAYPGLEPGPLDDGRRIEAETGG
jgi:hypothetical protein